MASRGGGGGGGILSGGYWKGVILSGDISSRGGGGYFPATAIPSIRKGTRGFMLVNGFSIILRVTLKCKLRKWYLVPFYAIISVSVSSPRCMLYLCYLICYRSLA